MTHTVIKVGGTSAATPEGFALIKELLLQDSRRGPLVVSAPGSNEQGDERITELLKSLKTKPAMRDETLRLVQTRFLKLVQALPTKARSRLRKIVRSTISQIREILSESVDDYGFEFIESRGEFLNAQILAAYLGWEFVDAADLICFNAKGRYDKRATRRQFKRANLAGRHVVIPGYYGADSKGRIRLFPRGGSDITGAIVAAETGAALYENGTDMPGVFRFNPKIVGRTDVIPHMTYSLMREFAYRGAGIFHWDAVLPVNAAGIPTRIFSVAAPHEPGTMIYPDGDPRGAVTGPLLGVAERAMFVVFTLHRIGLNADNNVTMRALWVLRRYGIGYEHPMSTIDSITLVVREDELSDIEGFAAALRSRCRADVSIERDVAVACVVGTGSRQGSWLERMILGALDERSIVPSFHEFGSSRTTFVIGMPKGRLHEALNAFALLA